MRKTLPFVLLFGLVLISLLQPGRGALAEVWTATPTTAVATRTFAVSDNPAVRPLVVIESYYLDKDTIRAGDSFMLFISLKNQGLQPATNLILSMINENFLPQDNGGVVALGSLPVGNNQTVTHAFLVSSGMVGVPVGTIPARLTYTGPDGTQYSETFAITLQLSVYYGPIKTQTPTPTVTVAPLLRPQLVVSSYRSSIDPLQPGTLFDLEVSARNLGNASAQSVTVVLGGGVQPDASGTPSPGGMSGGSSDLSNFAPIGSSNLFYVGNVAPGEEAVVKMHLIVNVSAQPGAYAVKLSFVYNDAKGLRLVDDQIITLLVYQLPHVEASFYRDPGLLYVGQTNVLPIQVVNMGRKSAILGNLKISAPNAEVTNNISLVGVLDAGGAFTLDANYIPRQAGPQEIELVIGYTDDFNQPRQITSKIAVNVQENALPTLVPGTPGGDGSVIPPVVEETLWDKAVRVIKGLLGLDSGAPQPANVNTGVQVEPAVPADSQTPAKNSTPLKSP
jgi:hypothetical protein